MKKGIDVFLPRNKDVVEGPLSMYKVHFKKGRQHVQKVNSV